MSEFNKDDYLNDLPDADELAAGQVAPEDGAGEAQPEANNDAQSSEEQGVRQEQPADEAAAPEEGEEADSKDGKLTPLGQAKKEAAEYLEALQRERAEFINYRNRTKKDMERAR